MRSRLARAMFCAIRERNGKIANVEARQLRARVTVAVQDSYAFLEGPIQWYSPAIIFLKA